jgi:hypothetical protein
MEIEAKWRDTEMEPGGKGGARQRGWSPETEWRPMKEILKVLGEGGVVTLNR